MGYVALVVLVCGIAQAAGLCDFSDSSTPVGLEAIIRWLPEEQRCEPDICRGLQLGDIPDVSGNLPASLLCALDMFDSARTLKEFSGKYMAVFGDSTLQENIYDIMILLSGISRDNAAMTRFMNRTVWLPWQDSDYFMEIPVLGDTLNPMLVTYHHTNRNATFSIPSHDILIKFRFSGHYDVRSNFGGIATFSESAWLDDFRCMVEVVGNGCAPKHPDFVVFNTGAHDIFHTLNDFTRKMKKLASWLGRVQRTLSTKVIWRGNNAVAHLHGQEGISRYYIEKEGIHYFDVQPIFARFRADLETDCCSDRARHGGIHVGFNHKYFANLGRSDARVTVSSLITQGLLGALFDDTQHCPSSGSLIQ